MAHIYHVMFVHSFITGHLGSFHLLAIMSNAAINTDGQIPVQISTLVGIAGSNSILYFNFFLKNRHIVFHTNCPILCYHQQHTRVSISEGVVFCL